MIIINTTLHDILPDIFICVTYYKVNISMKPMTQIILSEIHKHTVF